jgi:cation diffusion facilitator CzcD-associated flavoprotein CzcO
MSEEKQQVLDVVIIGAGVAGLAAAYGLNKPEIAHLYNVRIFERRTGEQSSGRG